MTPVWATHILDEDNLGDMVCCPADYFDLPVEGRIDFRRLLTEPLPQGSIIFGGGGLLHGEYVTIFERLEKKPERKLIAWGLGLNLHNETELNYRVWLDAFDLIGVRDHGTPFQGAILTHPIADHLIGAFALRFHICRSVRGW